MESTKKYIFPLLFSFAFALTSSAQKVTIGTYTFPKDGAQYYGDLESGKPYGKGKTKFRNGDTYVGEYVKGKRQGHGTYTFSDGERYEGDWMEDFQHGRGVYYFANKSTRRNTLWF